MNFIFINNCRHKALIRSRRVLSQYAEQLGKNIWEANLSQEGAEEVRAKLNSIASRHSSVACHVIKKSGFRQLLWIVGSRKHYNNDGLYAFSTRKKQTLWAGVAVPPMWVLIESMACLAGLLHDLGKANLFFQGKLTKKGTIADPVRHERLSLELFWRVLNSCKPEGKPLEDKVWLKEFSDQKWLHDKFKEAAERITEEATLTKKGFGLKDIRTLANLPPIASALCQLVVAHHKNAKGEEADGSYQMEDSKFVRDQTKKKIAGADKVFQWHKKSPWESKDWQSRVVQQIGKITKAQSEDSLKPEFLKKSLSSFTQYIARPAVVLADQLYSAQAKNQTLPDKFKGPIANTNAEGQPAQSLLEHLLRVSLKAGRMVRLFRDVMFDQRVEFLQEIPASLTQPLDSKSPFSWQEKADEAFTKHKGIASQPFFGVVMAETGSGKTRANLRIASAANGHQNIRATIALGMRSLTLQTGDELLKEVGLSGKDAKVMIGSQLALFLHEQKEGEGDSDSLKPEAEANFHNSDGQENESELQDLEAMLSTSLSKEDYNPDSPWPMDWAFPDKKKLAAVLKTPVLISTVDQVIGAVQSGRSSAAVFLLRFLSADLVLDEIDSYDNKALVALGKLAYLQGLFGRKLLLSSATLSPGICQAMFTAYWEGHKLHQSLVPGVQPPLAVGWFSHVASQQRILPQISGPEEFGKEQRKFSDKLVKHFEQAKPRRLLRLTPGESVTNKSGLFAAVSAEALALHHAHKRTLAGTELSFSIGAVRWNRVNWCQDFSMHLMGADPDPEVEILVLTYHAKFFPITINQIETELEKLLKHKFDDLNGAPERLQQGFEQAAKKNKKSLMVLVSTSPISEVGRDHDYDWAVLEPCSQGSMVQMAGRVWRHRPHLVAKVPNIALMPFATRRLDNPDDQKPWYYWPGPEEQGNDFSLMLCPDCRGVKEAFELGDEPHKITPIPTLSPVDPPVRLSKGHPTIRSLEHYTAALLLKEGHIHSLMPFLDCMRKEKSTQIHYTETHALKNPFRERDVKVAYWYDTREDSKGWRQRERCGVTNRVNCNIQLLELKETDLQGSYFSSAELSIERMKNQWANRLSQAGLDRDELIFSIEVLPRNQGYQYAATLGLIRS